MKKIVTVLLVACMFLSMGVSMGVSAARGENIISNGDFEAIGHLGTLRYWKVDGGTATPVTDIVHEGKQAVRLEHDGNMYIWQTIRPVSGEKYNFSFYARKPKDDGGNAIARIKVEAYGFDRKHISGSVKEETYSGLSDRWTKCALNGYEVPENTAYVSVLLRLLEGGVLYFDTVEVTGIERQIVTPDSESIPAEGLSEPVEGTGQLLQNPSFNEKDENGYPAGWNAFGSTWENNEYIEYVTDVGHGDNTSVNIKTDTGGYPWINQMVEIEGGAKYQLTGWYNAEIPGDLVNALVVKLEFYKLPRIAAGDGLPECKSDYFTSTHGAWKQVKVEFTAPIGAKYAVLYPRIMAPGVATVYYDDFELYKIGDLPMFKLTPDEVFYYPDAGEGTAILEMDTENYPDETFGYADFCIRDGETVIAEKKNVAAAAGTYAHFDYDVSFMELKKAYMLSATAYDTEGEVLETLERPIYMYPRPSILRADGIYEIDGKPFVPKFTYHVSTDMLDYCKEAGLNVVQVTTYDTIEQYQEVFDLVHSKGLKALVPLYFSMQPAAHPNNAARSREVITAFKDHPAVFAWAVQDEPWSHNPNCEDILFESYKLIRDIDDMHPVYVCDNPHGHYEITGLYVDHLVFDDYPTKEENVGYKLQDGLKETGAAVNYEKPISSLCSALVKVKDFTLLAHEMRNQIYQCHFMGGGWGVYPFDAESSTDKKDLHESIFWDELVKYKDLEYDLMDEYFALKQHKKFNRGGDDTYQYESFVKDGSVYMMVLNNLREEKTVEIPLISENGRVRADGWTLSGVNGAEKDGARVEGDKLIVDMTETQAAMFKLTPQTPISEDELTKTSFADLDTHTWAQEAIVALESEGIIPASEEYAYRPGENITRGDFAMLLVRTLGITMHNNKVQFDDVPEDAPYAKELALGKAFGILQGVGDNKFNPEAEITRQDMMTLVARGLELAGEADLGAFSDAGSIADYALIHVKAMIAEGFVQGNADGTINPRGNTTRAEAAVIMQRIFEKQ